VPKVRVSSFAISVDGFSAGPRQDLQNPLGERGMELMQWFFQTQAWRSTHGQSGGESGVDDRIAGEAMAGLGAWILGRNMFGPVRGPWPDESWRGWWGEEPPYHVPTFVLTHYARKPLEMKGGTTFHFVTEGIHAALDRAKAVAGDRDIRVGGGVATVRQYLQERLLDEIHLAVSPVVLGEGESLFDGIDIRALGYEVARHESGERAMHVYLRKSR
jgi:dihydrofolate reductase